MLDAGVQLATLAAALVVMGCAWVVSVPLRDASLADLAWGPCLAAIAWVGLVVGEGDPERGALVALLITVWALRLTLHLLWRHDGEDRRYRAMRERHGEGFTRRSLWSVFALQAVIAWIIALPVQAIAADPDPATLGLLTWAGVAVFAAGFAFEAVADFQLERFRRSPLNEGAVMSSGAWRYSRHPNYFGEACLWWGVWLIALETGAGWWTLIGPALLTFLLLQVSGVVLTERTIGGRRPGYEEYRRRTSAFVPLPPRARD